LKKSIYGNVDAALRLFIKYKGILKELGIMQSQMDPCVFYRLDENKKLDIIIACHVDDSIICGPKKIINLFMDKFEQHLKIERLGKMKEHLGISGGYGKKKMMEFILRDQWTR
jgi:hypothetical protein